MWQILPPLDHHLKTINTTYDLSGAQALPFHYAASQGPIIR
ncbi:MAG: hypothetical protein AAGM67_09615 [Bacteroidota bacterium]